MEGASRRAAVNPRGQRPASFHRPPDPLWIYVWTSCINSSHPQQGGSGVRPPINTGLTCPHTFRVYCSQVKMAGSSHLTASRFFLVLLVSELPTRSVGNMFLYYYYLSIYLFICPIDHSGWWRQCAFQDGAPFVLVRVTQWGLHSQVNSI